jgi:eukaryotic-like serine/threonine-protein kinase
MSFLKVDSWKDVAIHFATILGFSLVIGYIILYVWLPNYTNHDQQIEVPSVEHLSVEEAQTLLDGLDLRLEIQDTVYKSNFKPGVINRQEPKAKSFVKENRRIYVSVNALSVPKTEISQKMMNDLSNKGLEVVRSKIKEFGFDEGETIYVSGKYQDYVLHTICRDDTLRTGLRLPKGSKIDIVVSDGLKTE